MFQISLLIAKAACILNYLQNYFGGMSSEGWDSKEGDKDMPLLDE
jgi:hypothetical protein